MTNTITGRLDPSRPCAVSPWSPATPNVRWARAGYRSATDDATAAIPTGRPKDLVPIRTESN
jgi:hypothetical protein